MYTYVYIYIYIYYLKYIRKKEREKTQAGLRALLLRDAAEVLVLLPELRLGQNSFETNCFEN